MEAQTSPMEFCDTLYILTSVNCTLHVPGTELESSKAIGTDLAAKGVEIHQTQQPFLEPLPM
jgi:hypothetical protein